MIRPKVAFFDFTSCEGCQLCALNLSPEQMLELLEVIEIVEFREAISETAPEYDISMVEGAITRDADIPRLHNIRKRSRCIVAFGACAHIAGINALKNFQSDTDCIKAVYPDRPNAYETAEARAISEIIDIDAVIPGCPIDTEEFVRTVKNLVLGKDSGIPGYPLCVECKMKEYTCVYEMGRHCLGPVIRAGCGARCPGNGGYCFGCRGLISRPNVDSQRDIMLRYNLSFDRMQDQFGLFLQRNKEVFSHAR